MKPGAFQLFKTTDEQRAKSKNPDSYPDFQGKIKLNDETIEAIVSNHVVGNPIPDLRVAGWGRKAASGTVYISGTCSVDKPRESSITPQQADDFITTPALAAAEEGQPPVSPDGLPF